jgi:hypothetical protein
VARFALSPRKFRGDASNASLWLAAGLLILAAALSALGSGAAASVVRADTQPSLTVAVKSGTATQTEYTVTAAGFPAATAFTETLGDGTGIPPATGQTNASGGFTLFWTLDATTKYCGTISASAGSAQASTSFWVAVTTDSDSGTVCQSAGSGTPTAASTDASANATASAASGTPAATQAPAPLPTTAPASTDTSPTSGLGVSSLLHRIPWKWIGIGGGGLLVLIIVFAMIGSAGKRSGGGRRPPDRDRPGQWNGPGTTGVTRRQPAPQRQRPGGPWQGDGPRTSHRVPGAGRADSRWHMVNPQAHTARADNAAPRGWGDAASIRERARRRVD